MKIFAPFLLGYVRSKVLISVALTIVSFLLTGLDFAALGASLSKLTQLTIDLSDSQLNQGLAYAGVAFASLASGLGEITFLGYMSKFHENTISGWSSGTGWIKLEIRKLNLL